MKRRKDNTTDREHFQTMLKRRRVKPGTMRAMWRRKKTLSGGSKLLNGWKRPDWLK